MFMARDKPGIGRRLREFCWPSIGVQRAWHYRMHRLARMKVSPHQLAIGFAAGAFASFTPFIGFHFILAALVALLVRGNLIASAVGTVVGNPVTFPFIWIASYNVGAALLGISTKDHIELATDKSIGFFRDGPVAWFMMLWHSVEPVLWPMVLGGLPLGLACGFTCYWIVRSTLQRFRARRAAATP
jgi:uncharacterized protein (DUF2062 family)